MRSNVVVLSVVLLFGATACNGSNPDPQDDKPKVAELVTGKRIDPPVYKTESKCVKKNTKKVCIQYKTTKKETDDRDWVLITTGGEYDVEENEYESVQLGETWPQ